MSKTLGPFRAPITTAYRNHFPNNSLESSDQQQKDLRKSSISKIIITIFPVLIISYFIYNYSVKRQTAKQYDMIVLIPNAPEKRRPKQPVFPSSTNTPMSGVGYKTVLPYPAREIQKKYDLIRLEELNRYLEEKKSYETENPDYAKDWAYTQINQRYNENREKIQADEFEEICLTTKDILYCESAVKLKVSLKKYHGS